MKENIYIIGVGMTKISKDGGSYEDLCRAAISEAMEDSGLSFEGDKNVVGGIWYGNCGQGMLTSQHSIRGQVILRRLGFECMPVVNVENACATASTALNQAVNHVLAGISDVALAVGIEKIMPDLTTLGDFPEIAAALPHMGLASFWVGCEQDKKKQYIEKWRKEKSEVLGIPYEETDVGKDRSPFMDYYAVKAIKVMKKYGYTQEQLARVCAKTHHHSTMNPKAQYQKDISWEEVMADKLITYPLTRPMCAPTGEGCAAAIVCSEKYLNEHKNIKDPILILASVLVSGRARGDFDQDISGRGAQIAFSEAKLTRKDIDVLELHDATTFGEIFQTAQAGFCTAEDAGIFCSSGATSLGGELPTNVSGGLISRGHPVGCTGLAQAYELATQLRGRAGARQVKGAKIGMQLNGGGLIGVEEAALGAHIYRKAE
ncbi:MAG: thiolase [Deltaproteobacteria bacterium HGW-Deltaproteobacteria-10]|nr:MAG: thiolase [Deltaproteobacteria bacterium HGW-Deltaproteobacteria-10]